MSVLTGPPLPNDDSLPQTAVIVLRAATQLDCAERYGDAFQNYVRGIEILMVVAARWSRGYSIIACDVNDPPGDCDASRAALLRQKAEAYMLRAEEIRAFLQSSASASSGPPDSNSTPSQRAYDPVAINFLPIVLLVGLLSGFLGYFIGLSRR